MKDNLKTASWVVHSPPVVDDIKASVTGNTVEQKDYWGGNNTALLQGEEEQDDEETNNYAGFTAESNKIDENNNYMVILIEEDQKTFKYRETINVNVENIANNIKNWMPIYEVVDHSFFAATKNFQQNF